MGLRDILSSVIEQQWSDTKVKEYLGHGAYGYVFRCVKEDANVQVCDEEAVKIIPIPLDDMDIEDVRKSGKDPEKVFLEQLNDAVNEIKKLVELKSPHIVHINRYTSVRQENGVGWYLIFSMDLLTDLKSRMCEIEKYDRVHSEKIAIKLAMDICDALAVCEEENEVHRDIKPENIFVSKRGDYYLGDFGISRKIVSNITNMSSRGTEEYVAPEVQTMSYDGRADIYSLGLVLYQVLNHGRLPFYPPYPNEIRASHENEAQSKRLSGINIPFPSNCSTDLGNIVLKMCKYNPQERYPSAKDIIDDIKYLENCDPIGDTSKYSNDKTFNDYADDDYKTNSQYIYKENMRTEKKDSVPIVTMLGLVGVFLIIITIGTTSIIKTILNQQKKEEVGLIEENNDNDSNELSKKDIIIEKTEGELLSENSESIEEEITIASKDNIKLSDMKIIEYNDASIKSEKANSLGNNYTDVLLLDEHYGKAYARYYLNRQYERFIGTMSCDDETFSETSAWFEVYLDDEESNPVFSEKITRSTEETILDIDTTGAKYITFQLRDRKGTGIGALVSDGMLYIDYDDGKLEATKVPANNTKLSGMKIIEYNDASIKSEKANSLGNNYTDVLLLDEHYGKAYARYYLNGQYERFIGTMSCDDETFSETSAWFEVYLDDEECNSQIMRLPL